MTIPELIIYSLAAYRISLMVSREDGPAWIFRKLRNAPPARSSVKQGLSCQLCVSVWAAGLLMIYHELNSAGVLNSVVVNICDALILLLVISAIAICVHMTFTKGI